MSSSQSDVIKPTPGGLAAQFTALAPKNRRPRRVDEPGAKDASPRATGTSTASTKPAAKDSPGDPSSAPTPAAAQTKTPTKRASAAVGERGTAAGAQKVRRTAFVPLELHDLAAIHCAQTKRTRSQMVLHALAANLQELPRLVADDDALATGDAGKDSEDISDIFPDLEPTRRALPTRPMPLYFTSDQIERIDSWVGHYGARDRSHLITVALRAYLGR